MTRLGGYQGPRLPGLGYLGVGVVVVAVVGLVVWRHDRRLLLFGAIGVAAAVLSLGPGHGYWVPWQVMEKVPWVGNIVEIRFTAVLTLCLAVMVTVTIDRSRAWLSLVDPTASPPGRKASAVASALAAGHAGPHRGRPVAQRAPHRAGGRPAQLVRPCRSRPSPGERRSVLSASLLRPAVLPGVAGGQPDALGPGRWRRTGGAGGPGRCRQGGVRGPLRCLAAPGPATGSERPRPDRHPGRTPTSGG